jgi:hypothetical protein
MNPPLPNNEKKEITSFIHTLTRTNTKLKISLSPTAVHGMVRIIKNMGYQNDTFLICKYDEHHHKPKNEHNFGFGKFLSSNLLNTAKYFFPLRRATFLPSSVSSIIAITQGSVLLSSSSSVILSKAL